MRVYMYRGKTVVDTKLFPNPSENFILAFNKIPISWVHITCGKFMYSSGVMYRSCSALKHS